MGAQDQILESELSASGEWRPYDNAQAWYGPQIAARSDEWTHRWSAAELAEIRAAAPDLPFLVPGVGAQGGDAATVVEHGANAAAKGLIVSSSRAVLYASSGANFAEAARAEAQRTAAPLIIAGP